MFNFKNLAQRPFIISGPCSAETEYQVLETARLLASTGKIDMLRAGVWKPRTKPGMFEGVGETALPWLNAAKKATGLPVCVEVATAKHVELALKFGIDTVWIGARTTVNPFSVQEIADALKGVDIPVLIKNPVNPDVELWAGAKERIEKAGIKDLGLIHRGFASYSNTEYRNPPMWQLAIEMKRRYPDTLLICDPSHICGNRTLLQEVAQKSIDLDYGGLMIESHITPDEAWSDARQQITPAQLSQMLDGLIWKKAEGSEVEKTNLLNDLRFEIDQIDDELLQLLARRMHLADKIGQYKKENNITVLQTRRWNNILKRSLAKAPGHGLTRDFILKYLDAIHMESIQHQINIINETKRHDTQ